MSAPTTSYTSLAAIVLFGLLPASSRLSAQEPLPKPQLQVPYRCADGTAYIVQYCNQGRQELMCYLHIEKNGMLVAQSFQPRPQMTSWMSTCPVKAGAPESQAFSGSYVREMPSVDRVKREIQGSNPTDTLARQMAVLSMLEQFIYRLMGPYRDRNTLKPEETQAIRAYYTAASEISQSFAKSHSPDEVKALNELRSRLSTNPALFQEVFEKLLTPAIREEYAKANAAFEAKSKEAIAAARREAEAQKMQQAAGPGGSPFIRNDPGTLAARRCVELGGSELECIGKGLTTGVAGLFGGATEQAAGKNPRAGLVMTGRYAATKTMGLSFGDEAVALTGCGKLIPNSRPYTVEKSGARFVVTVKTEPQPFALTMGPDGHLTGPGPTDVKGQIITGYRQVWMQEYRNGLAVTGSACGGVCGYWASQPIFADKTERCTIGGFSPTGPTGDGGVLSTLTALVSPQSLDQTPTESGKGLAAPGVRMAGKYTGPGGLALEFRDNGVILDCGEAHVAKPYTVEAGAAQVLIAVKNAPAPFTLALGPDGTLTGSGTVDVTGRVVTGSTANGIAFAPRSARCAVGVLTLKR
ncbi:MAG TPA: hypothetical protein VEU96_13175 [Bryobacteraceae bacterium]|nr:hypothetical protein [Bryobacteraceae bacterium]